MLPKVIVHNSISLDGSLINFEPNMETHYQIECLRQVVPLQLSPTFLLMHKLIFLIGPKRVSLPFSVFVLEISINYFCGCSS